jgi:hypothetical protein
MQRFMPWTGLVLLGALCRLAMPAPARAATPISGYGPYELGRWYDLSRLPEGLERGNAQELGGYRLQTVSGTETLTFGGETFQGTLTLYLLDGVLVLQDLTIPLEANADPRQVRRFTLGLHDQLAQRYGDDLLQVDSFSGDHRYRRRRREHRGRWGGRLILSEADDAGGFPTANVVGLFVEDDSIVLLYSTAASRRLLGDTAGEDESSIDKL